MSPSNFKHLESPLRGAICGCKSGVTTTNRSIELPRSLRSTRMRPQLTEDVNAYWDSSTTTPKEILTHIVSKSKIGVRPGPELNRGWRFCRPQPYHLATGPYILIAHQNFAIWASPASSISRGRMASPITTYTHRRDMRPTRPLL